MILSKLANHAPNYQVVKGRYSVVTGCQNAPVLEEVEVMVGGLQKPWRVHTVDDGPQQPGGVKLGRYVYQAVHLWIIRKTLKPPNVESVCFILFKAHIPGEEE
jgi:hypothetical protein